MNRSQYLGLEGKAQYRRITQTKNNRNVKELKIILTGRLRWSLLKFHAQRIESA